MNFFFFKYGLWSIKKSQKKSFFGQNFFGALFTKVKYTFLKSV
jgi:hypothetical protein